MLCRSPNWKAPRTGADLPARTDGAPLVKACAENGVHYVDLTGEAPFVADMIKAHARSAVSTRALMLHSCGYDSVPSDLCAFLAVQRLKKIAGERVKVGEVSAAFSLQGGASGGTLASLLEMLESGPEAQKIARNPFCLSPSAFLEMCDGSEC